MIVIKEVKGRRMLKTFIDFPVKLYKDNKYFTPYLYMDEVSNLTVDKNPASKYCEFKLFLAYKDNKVVGRICGILNHFSNEKYNQSRIRFNRIDMIDDIEVTKALIKAVEDFGRSKGMTEINGPLGYSDQDKEGMLTKGFDQMNMFVTFYTHPYYVEHLKKLGFSVDAVWNEYRINIPKEVPQLIKRMAERVRQKTEFRLLEVKHKKELKPYVNEVLRLNNLAYKDLYGYVPIDDKQIAHLANQYMPMLNIDYLQIVVDKSNKVVGYGLMLPSPAKALKKCKGHLFPFGWIMFLNALKHSKSLDMLLVAIHPDFQNQGIYALIVERAIENAIKNKIEFAETGPELQTNKNVQSLWKVFEAEKHKERCCFLKAIE